jgi:hypothetical protein
MRVALPLSLRLAGAGAVALTVASSGCAWQTYAVTRTARELTGAKTRLHVIEPMASTLRAYGMIEFAPVVNLVGSRVPVTMVHYLHERITATLRALPANADPAASTAVVEGFLDDYDAGSRAMRLAEIGFNHIAVTVRIRVLDKSSGRLLGAASITAEDDSASGTTTGAIDNAAERLRAFIATGYAQ